MQVAKPKDKIMQTNINCFYKQPMNGMDIDSIKMVVLDSLNHRLDREPDSILTAGKQISINSKNIEYSETFIMSDYVASSENNKKLKGMNIVDIIISLTIYRVGQHSYFAASMDFVSVPEDNKDCLEIVKG